MMCLHRNVSRIVILVIVVCGGVVVQSQDVAGSKRQVNPKRNNGPHSTPITRFSQLPKHAYSPFDEISQKEHQGKAARAEHMPYQVLIKVKAKTGNGLPQPIHKQVSNLKGVKGMGLPRRVFPRAKAPSNAKSTGQGNMKEKPDMTRWFTAKVQKGHTVEEVISRLKNNPAVAIAEPDYLFKLTEQMEAQGDGGMGIMSIPDSGTDPKYADQWHLDAVNAPAAWAHLEGLGLDPGGNSDIIIAVIDTGVDYTHPDLAPNMWINSQEIPNNSIDDDGNGFVDDIHGVTVVGNSGSHSGNPMDDHAHGTHVAGIIAAVAENGIGGVGIAYNTRIMAIKAAQYSGVLTASDIAEAIYYAVEHGADVINMSFGGAAQSSVVEDALAVAFGQAVLVAAAGNNGKHNEIPPVLPSPQPNLLRPATMHQSAAASYQPPRISPPSWQRSSL